MFTEMNGEPWNPVPPKDKAPQVRGVYIALERQIKYGGTKGCSACFRQAKVHSPECRARFQDFVDNEAAQTAAASPAPAAGGPAPEDVNMGAAESSAAQPTSSAVRTLETSMMEVQNVRG